MTDNAPIEATADHVIDDVPRHLAAKGFLPQLPREAVYTHMGLYLGWAMDRGMMSETFQSQHAGDVAAFRDKRLTGPQLAGRMDGVLYVSLFNNELARFSRLYYAKTGRFYGDYIRTFLSPIAAARSMYVATDTWENQDKLSRLLDERLDAWRAYPPAAESIFGPGVGRGSIIDLETVTQMALLAAAKALKLTRICRPFVVLLTPSDEVRVPQVLSHNGKNIHVMTDEGVAESVECLREGLKLRTVKVFAAARLRSDESSTPASDVEVIAQHFKSGPHRVVAPAADSGSTPDTQPGRSRHRPVVRPRDRRRRPPHRHLQGRAGPDNQDGIRRRQLHRDAVRRLRPARGSLGPHSAHGC